jgi:hypothetical protein
LADILIADDQFGGPLDRAVRLVEYVARTKGADHLKVGSRHLNDWQGCMKRFNNKFYKYLVVEHLNHTKDYCSVRLKISGVGFSMAEMGSDKKSSF